MKGSSWIVPYNNANTIRWFQTLRRFAWTAYLKFLEILSEYVSLLRDTIYVLSGDAKSEPNRNFPYSLNYGKIIRMTPPGHYRYLMEQRDRFIIRAARYPGHRMRYRGACPVLFRSTNMQCRRLTQLTGNSRGTKKLTGEDSRCIFLFLDATESLTAYREVRYRSGLFQTCPDEDCQVFVDYPAARDGS